MYGNKFLVALDPLSWKSISEPCAPQARAVLKRKLELPSVNEGLQMAGGGITSYSRLKPEILGDNSTHKNQ